MAVSRDSSRFFAGESDNDDEALCERLPSSVATCFCLLRMEEEVGMIVDNSLRTVVRIDVHHSVGCRAFV